MENKQKEQNLRVYSKSQIACLYMPDIEPENAVKKLNCWIKKHPTLADELKNSGVTPGMRRYTPNQAQLIFNAFGEP